MPAPDLETAREDFLRQMRNDGRALLAHERFSAYWQQVEDEAKHSEDMGELDRWLKDLARDRDRLAELKSAKQVAEGGQLGMDARVEVLLRLIALLTDIEGTLKKRLWELRDRLGMWVFLAGVGVKSKPVPEAAKDPSQQKKDAKQAAAKEEVKPLLQRPQQKRKPTKQKGA